MGRSGQHHPLVDPASAVLLEGVAHVSGRPERDSLPRPRPVVAMAVVVVVLLGLLLVPTEAEVQAGRRHHVDVRFGDAFDTEWIALEAHGDLPTSPAGPLPMASLEPSCVGFGRPDWPEEHRHPSVAHCADADDIAGIGGDGVALVRESLVGDNTWFVLRFGDDLVGVEVSGGPRSASGTERVYRIGPYAAVLLPTGLGPFHLTWEVRGGSRYRCDFGQPAAQAGPCT